VQDIPSVQPTSAIAKSEGVLFVYEPAAARLQSYTPERKLRFSQPAPASNTIVAAVHARSRATCGAPRAHAALRLAGGHAPQRPLPPGRPPRIRRHHLRPDRRGLAAHSRRIAGWARAGHRRAAQARARRRPVRSMSRAGERRDNALAARVGTRGRPTRAAARTATFARGAVCYDRRRAHFALASRAPATSEETALLPEYPVAKRESAPASVAA